MNNAEDKYDLNPRLIISGFDIIITAKINISCFLKFQLNFSYSKCSDFRLYRIVKKTNNGGKK
ncbi:hypothetical protein RYU24_00850 [Acinetobacter variabilis]|nr:hypothetical protein RYU24_00850 [Acinetobacter variabilis]